MTTPLNTPPSYVPKDLHVIWDEVMEQYKSETSPNFKLMIYGLCTLLRSGNQKEIGASLKGYVDWMEANAPKESESERERKLG